MQTITIRRPEKRDVIINFRATQGLSQRLNELSEQSGATLSSTVCQILEQAAVQSLAGERE